MLIEWIQQFIPLNPDFAFFQYALAYALLGIMCVLILSFFVGIFTAIFKRY